jgi:uncharacterized protein YbcC (UPF0753/DUF2309 family)
MATQFRPLPEDKAAEGGQKPFRPQALTRSDSDSAAFTAIRRIAPLWPLKNFVAVNPFLGLTSMSFAAAAQRMADTMGARLTQSRKVYTEALREGRITDTDIAQALADTPSSPGLPQSPHEVRIRGVGPAASLPPRLPSVADIIALYKDIDWPRLIVEHIGAFCARQFDDGEAAWASPVRSLGVWTAFQAEARHDRSLELIGLSGMRDMIAAMPASALETIHVCAQRLGLSADALECYFHRLLADLPGWAGHARYRLWQAELDGRNDTALLELLAVRLACETALLQTLLPTSPAMAGWVKALKRINAPQPIDTELAIDCVLQRALEYAWQRDLAQRLEDHRAPVRLSTPEVQAVFCIDVRSEPLRRALETQSPDIETLGFAGFFGLALDYLPLGQRQGRAQCPVLLKPGMTLHEHVHGANEAETLDILRAAQLGRRTEGALATFKRAAVASFAYVETLGPAYALKLISDSLGLSRPAPKPTTTGFNEDVINRLGPDISQLSAATMTDAAETMLRAMSLTGPFAPLVVFIGHGSSTVNNPHGSGLDCGACGGHDGAPNARAAAQILNQPEVRAGLATRGIRIPEDSWFAAGLHDTTTDEVRFFDEAMVPAARRADLGRLRRMLAIAGEQTRMERAGALALDPDGNINDQIKDRATDWSQVRPEWGLANCAAFIAAPRSRTQGLDLQGRSFLHNYAWEADAARGYPVLRLIMTAPMVVASWISLQYYGSSVDNAHFGAGNKLLHNAVGSLGVLEGQGGDLRPGLPFQSVHDGQRLRHEPLRLSVIIEAPTDAIDTIIAHHDDVRDLVNNQWLHLFAMDDHGRLQRWTGLGRWD